MCCVPGRCGARVVRASPRHCANHRCCWARPSLCCAAPRACGLTGAPPGSHWRTQPIQPIPPARVPQGRRTERPRTRAPVMRRRPQRSSPPYHPTQAANPLLSGAVLGAALAVDALDDAASTAAAAADPAGALPRAVLLVLLAAVSVLLPVSVLRAGSIALIEVHVPAPCAHRCARCALCTSAPLPPPLPLHASYLSMGGQHKKALLPSRVRHLPRQRDALRRRLPLGRGLQHAPRAALHLRTSAPSPHLRTICR